MESDHRRSTPGRKIGIELILVVPQRGEKGREEGEERGEGARADCLGRSTSSSISLPDHETQQNVTLAVPDGQSSQRRKRAVVGERNAGTCVSLSRISRLFCIVLIIRGHFNRPPIEEKKSDEEKKKEKERAREKEKEKEKEKLKAAEKEKAKAQEKEKEQAKAAAKEAELKKAKALEDEARKKKEAEVMKVKIAEAAKQKALEDK